ncbi:hypothetical protein [Flammeovirga sp. EKP202]|uniref:hypothetical protein n=1 Tax=Flammeovirga sp. EKP202 TaxID=2770592 RepID=UPI00165F2BEB|nr:hypothetical protein [Flammeovirga sp. EKP202]MBD0400704.1 hypothetical protein [Flammeovirga sp. EKP202]
MKAIVQITILMMVVSHSMFAQKRYISEDIIDDSEKIAEEIVEGIFNTEPHAYLEGISMVSFEQIEEDYFSVYQEVSEYLIDEDAFEVVLLLDDTIETRYYNATGQAFLIISEHSNETFPAEILANFTNVKPACEVIKRTVIQPTSAEQVEVYKVTLLQAEKTKVAYFKRGEEGYKEFRFKDITMLQK